MHILFLSHTYWDSVFRVGSHHLAHYLALMGHRIVYISTPISPFHYLRRARFKNRLRTAGTIRNPEPGIHTLVPLMPLPIGNYFLGNNDLAFLCRDFLSGALHKSLAHTYDIVFIDDPKFAGLLPGLSYRHLVYRPTDVYKTMGMKHWEILESLTLKYADRIIATSEPVADFMQDHFHTSLPMMVQVNGVDTEFFATPQPRPPEYSDTDRKRCVYVGAIDFRFDMDAVIALSAAFPLVDFHIIGPQPSLKPEAANLHFLGSRPYSEIPAYLQHADVGLLPLQRIPANQGRSPMKIYEYRAAGLPVVSLETEELKRRQTPGVYLYTSPADLNVAFENALRAPRSAYSDDGVAWKNIAARVLEFATAVLPDNANMEAVPPAGPSYAS